MIDRQIEEQMGVCVEGGGVREREEEREGGEITEDSGNEI